MNAHNRHVSEYFDQTHNDYRRLWGIDRHLGLHCGYFDAAHPRHDAAVTNMNRVLAAMARIAPGEEVLDAGCGVGGSAIWLAENFPHLQATGVNINSMQIALANDHARQRGLQSRVRFQVGDYARTGLPSESFDVVWALESMCYAYDKPAFLAEAFRLLRPGGRLVVADVFLTREPARAWERQLVARWCRGWAVPHVPTVRQFPRQLLEAGFQQAEFRDITSAIAPSSRRILIGTLLFYPFALLLYWAGLRSEIQTRGIASGYYQYAARRAGLGVYSLCCAEK